jgi:SAM-dependent methyltransferase
MQYDRARPSYAAAMVDDLLAEAPHRVVDVGSGTGIVSRLFTARGCEVLGVEADERMAAVARRHGLTVEVARFEDWTPPAAPFDLLVSGQAWHWIDPGRGMARAAATLRSGGRFAVFWNVYRHDPAVNEAFRDIYERLAPDLADSSVALGTARVHVDRDDDEAALSPHGFDHVEHRLYDWDRYHTRDEWLDQLPTHSGHRRLQHHVLTELLDAVGSAIDQLGGSITVHHSTRLLTAVRT